MKYFLIFLLVPFMSVSECGKKKNKTGVIDGKEAKDSVPACVRQRIDAGMKENPRTTPLQVDEYDYKGRKVYLFTADCCDFFNTVYDENCKEICAPSGGITGKGDGKCPGFSDEAKHVRIIWKKEEK